MQVHVSQAAKGLSWVNKEQELFGFWVESEWVTTCMTASWGDNICALNTEETALNIAFLLLNGDRSADKIRARLEMQLERNFHSGAGKHLRARLQWMQLSSLSSCPSYKSLSLRTRVPGSQVFTYLPAALRYIHTPQGSIFSFPGWGRLDFLQNTCSRLKLSTNHWTRGSELHVLEDAEAPFNRPGVVTVWLCSWILGSVLCLFNHMAHSCCDTEDLRDLAQWNLTSLGFWKMRSGRYKSEVTNREACRFFS